MNEKEERCKNTFPGYFFRSIRVKKQWQIYNALAKYAKVKW